MTEPSLDCANGKKDTSPILKTLSILSVFLLVVAGAYTMVKPMSQRIDNIQNNVKELRDLILPKAEIDTRFVSLKETIDERNNGHIQTHNQSPANHQTNGYRCFKKPATGTAASGQCAVRYRQQYGKAKNCHNRVHCPHPGVPKG